MMKRIIHGKIRTIACLLGLLGIGLLCTAQAADIEEVQYNTAVNLYNAGQWQASVSKIDERLKLNLTDEMRAKYVYARGLALERGNKADDARAAYATVIEKFPKAPECNASRLSLLYLDYAAGRVEAVVKGYEVIDKGPLNAEDKRNLALMAAECLYGQDKFKDALAAYRQALALGADAKPLTGKLFHLYLRLQMHAELLALTAGGPAEIKSDQLALARTEALLALGRNAEVEAEAAKVPAQGPLAPRAAFARAQALIRLGKLKEAVGPLETAVKGLTDPPAPASAYLALAECLVEAGRAAEADGSLARAVKLAAGLPDAERKAMEQQITGVRLRMVNATGDRKKLIRAVTEAGDLIPAAQRPQMLYLKLFAMAEEGKTSAILQSMKEDYPLLQVGAEDGPATLIYYKALKDSQRQEEGTNVLEAFVKRKPGLPEALKARVELARAAMDKQDCARALEWLQGIGAAPNACAVLGTNLLADALYNQAVMAFKVQKPDETLKAVAMLAALKPDTNLLARAQVLGGDTCLGKKDYSGAARFWTAALAGGKVEDEPGLRERLGVVLCAARDYPAAIAQFDRAVERHGNDRKLARESLEAWARALFETRQYVGAAERFSRLYDRFSDTPAYAYEAALALERAGKPAEAEHSYRQARERMAQLPPEYAGAVDGALARLRLEAGLGDLGLSYWIEAAATPTNGVRFLQAVTMIRRIIDTGTLTAKVESGLHKAMQGLATNQPEYYLIGALRLQCLVNQDKLQDAGALAVALAAAFAAHEKGLDAKSAGATLAPAMIYFFQGEAARRAGHAADALAAYETVLAAYPYNEWPDAAACGAAECYASFGDTNTALVKFGEVAAQPTNSASRPWVLLAQKRIGEIKNMK